MRSKKKQALTPIRGSVQFKTWGPPWEARNIWGPAGPAPNRTLLSTGPLPARPPMPHFYRRGPGQPGPQSLTFIDGAQASPAPNPSLLLARAHRAKEPHHITYGGDVM